MSINLSGGKVKVTVEAPNGMTYSGLAHVVEITQECMPPAKLWHGLAGYSDYIESTAETIWHMELSGIGDPLWVRPREEAVKHQRELRSAHEWACDYCGAVWPKATAQCVQCGGWRSFVYDV